MKKKEQKFSDKRVEQIQELAARIEKEMEEMNIAAEYELEVFAETVALLIIHWGRVCEWSPLETTAYAGYVMTSFMEKGIGAEIKDLRSWHYSRKQKGN